MEFVDGGRAQGPPRVPRPRRLKATAAARLVPHALLVAVEPAQRAAAGPAPADARAAAAGQKGAPAAVAAAGRRWARAAAHPVVRRLGLLRNLWAVLESLEGRQPLAGLSLGPRPLVVLLLLLLLLLLVIVILLPLDVLSVVVVVVVVAAAAALQVCLLLVLLLLLSARPLAAPFGVAVRVLWVWLSLQEGCG